MSKSCLAFSAQQHARHICTCYAYANVPCLANHAHAIHTCERDAYANVTCQDAARVCLQVGCCHNPAIPGLRLA
eukprot:4318289-Lingulodinium_polyedra.AAC.1